MINGGLLIDKPGGLSSHGVVARVRRIVGQKRVGHTGTLDPLATGLMICVLGNGTKLAPHLTHQDKTYECDMRLGAATDTYDSEGRLVSEAPERIPHDRESVEAAIAPLRGEILQTPPLYSAIHVKGKRLYQYARANESVEIPSRRVRVGRFDLLEFAPPRLRFVCHVSAGAYVRSLCHDLGEALGCGGHMTALRRTRVGRYDIQDAVTLEALEAAHAEGRLSEWVLDLPALAPEMPHVRVDNDGRARIAHGNVCPGRLIAPGGWGATPDQLVGQTALVLDENEETIALGEIGPPVDSSGAIWAIHPRNVFIQP